MGTNAIRKQTRLQRNGFALGFSVVTKAERGDLVSVERILVTWTGPNLTFVVLG